MVDLKNNRPKIVIKVGTQAILSEKGEILESTLASIVRQIITLQQKGVHVVLVSSGAVGSGRRVARNAFGREYGHSIAEKQVLASIGQPELMQTYSTLLQKYHVLAAQLLLTKQDFQTRAHYLNIARIFQEILSHQNILPIVNENDSVAVEELMFTDNDELAALISTQINADKLIVLTTVKGVYDLDPTDPAATVIPVINPDDKWQKISTTKSPHGRGGMISKLSSARKMSDLGVTTHIVHVNEEDVILRLMNNESIGTTVLPFKKKSNVKRWMAFHYHKNNACIHINAQLYELMQDRLKARSILPVGIVKYSGEFEKGDLIDILAPNGQKIGVGLAKYGHESLKEYLGKNNKPAFIHYDHLYIEKLG
ncbi:MAG: glutamate 5-kinase [Candidatus Berkiellales bacterium]